MNTISGNSVYIKKTNCLCSEFSIKHFLKHVALTIFNLLYTCKYTVNLQKFGKVQSHNIHRLLDLRFADDQLLATFAAKYAARHSPVRKNIT